MEMMELSFFEMSQRREHYTLLACILRQLATLPATVSLLSTLRFDNLHMQVHALFALKRSNVSACMRVHISCFGGFSRLSRCHQLNQHCWP